MADNEDRGSTASTVSGLYSNILKVSQNKNKLNQSRFKRILISYRVQPRYVCFTLRIPLELHLRKQQHVQLDPLVLQVTIIHRGKVWIFIKLLCSVKTSTHHGLKRLGEGTTTYFLHLFKSWHHSWVSLIHI